MSEETKRRTAPAIGRRGLIATASLVGAAALTRPVVAKELNSDVELAIRNLVIANRILAHENVVDAYGHVSMRHPLNPQHYLLSRSRSPEQVEVSDIVEYTL